MSQFSLTLREQDKIRFAAPHKYLNLKQRMCQGPCKQRRSVGQFSHDPDLCDRCYQRKPKAG